MKRQDVIDALIERLEGILTTAGYNTDIGTNVQSMYELEIDEETELPIINVREGDSDVVNTFGPEWQHDCPVEINICMEGTIEEIRLAADDVLKAIGYDKTLDGLCVDIIPGGIQVRKAERGESYAEAQVNVTLQYLSDEWEV